MGNNVSTRHHLVPESWLKGFADAGQLCVRRRDRAQDITMAVSDATVVGKFYSNPRPSEGEDGQEVEAYLATEVEGPAAGALRDIHEGRWPLNPKAELALRKLLAHQLVRTRSFRALGKHIEKHALPVAAALETAPLVAERLGKASLSEQELHQLTEFYRKNPPEIEELLNPRRDLTHQLKAADRLEGTLASWNLTLLRAERDRPLLLLPDIGAVVRQADGSYSSLPPVLPERAELFAALAPHLLLIATLRTDGTATGVLQTKRAAQANRGAVGLCHDAVIRRPGQQWPKGMRLQPAYPGLLDPAVTYGVGPEAANEAETAPRQLNDSALAAIVEKLNR